VSSKTKTFKGRKKSSSQASGPRSKKKSSSSTTATEGPTPLELTQALLDVSVTERGQFRTCRRRWVLETLENLEPISPQWALEIGTGVHAALEAYYLSVGMRKPPALKARQGIGRAEAITQMDAWHNRLAIKLNGQGPEVLDELHENRRMIGEMFENYLRFDETARVQLGRPLAVEGVLLERGISAKVPEGYHKDAKVTRHPSGRLLVPIVDPTSKAPFKMRAGPHSGEVPKLSARIDLLTERKTPKRGLWVDDHKALTRAPSDKGLEFDDQVTGYCYVVWRWLARAPRGVVYNALIKNEVLPPRVGKSGKLSTAKDQRTTPDLYREALKEHELMDRRGEVESEEHAACLAGLLARGWDPFFKRLETTRNFEQLMRFEERLYEEFFEMEKARNDSKLQYPNPHTMLCPNCSVAPICLAMEDGSDFEDIKTHRYRQAEDRKDVIR
jgi:hypothetical protein